MDGWDSTMMSVKLVLDISYAWKEHRIRQQHSKPGTEHALEFECAYNRNCPLVELQGGYKYIYGHQDGQCMIDLALKIINLLIDMVKREFQKIEDTDSNITG